MIIVIADDFSGAAELAGISLGYGLTVSLCLDGSLQGESDVYIISTDSRSMKKDAALLAVRKATEKVAALKPDLLFKKIDSVLRGYVADELIVQMEVMGVDRALILPANPSLGRTIKDGRYFIDGVNIMHTSFARDPEFAIQSSEITEMLAHPVKMLNQGQDLSEGLNSVSSAESLEEIEQWATQVGISSVVAGSGDFFNALLKRKYTKRAPVMQPSLSNAHVYVSGTSFNKSVELIKYYGSSYTAYIDEQMIAGKAEGFAVWAKRSVPILQQHQQLIVAFNDTVNNAAFEAASLRATMAEYVKRLAGELAINELLIEGGSTAAAIFQLMGINCFEPVFEWERGVVQMKAHGMLITVKPGSYQLPEPIRQRYKLYEDV